MIPNYILANFGESFLKINNIHCKNWYLASIGLMFQKNNLTHHAHTVYHLIANRTHNHPDIYYLTGILHYQKNNLHKAIAYVRQAIKISPHCHLYLFNLAILYFKNGQHKKNPY